MLKDWEGRIQQFVKLDAKSAKSLETQLLLINKVKTQYVIKMKALMELFLLKQSKSEAISKNEKIDKFNHIVTQFQDLIEDSKVAKVYITNYKGLKINNIEVFYDLLAEMNDTEKILIIATKEIKEILAHETDMNSNGGNNSNMNVILRSYVKQKLEDFQTKLQVDKIKTRDLLIRLKKFIEGIFSL